MSSSAVKHISKCFVKPKYEAKESKYPYHLTPWGLALLSLQYIQTGLLFSKPQLYSIETLLESLKDSLSLTLVHFYPLAGQLTTQVNEDRHESLVFVDCNKGPGAKFTHATSQMTVSDILSPTDVPLLVQSFFDFNKAMNHDGHTQPLLSVQVTEFLDGIFIGVSMNHVLVDGTSYWNFWNTWSEIHEATTNGKRIYVSSPPVHNCWIAGGYSPGIPLPFTHPNEFISKYEAPQLRERIFHFSSECIRRLKEKVNKENKTQKISSLQALTALVWRSNVRANRSLSHDQLTNCGLAINNRHRLHPIPLPQNYFRNSINIITANTTVGELLKQNLGQAALLVHQSVANHTSTAIYDLLKGWQEAPFVYKLDKISRIYSVLMTHSPRFDMYGNDFGFGKPMAVRSGCTNKFAGNLAAYPGYEGGGSIDLEVYVTPDSMRAIESDEEFMDYVTSPYMVAKQSPS